MREHVHSRSGASQKRERLLLTRRPRSLRRSPASRSRSACSPTLPMPTKPRFDLGQGRRPHSGAMQCHRPTRLPGQVKIPDESDRDYPRKRVPPDGERRLFGTGRGSEGVSSHSNPCTGTGALLAASGGAAGATAGAAATAGLGTACAGIACACAVRPGTGGGRGVACRDAMLLARVMCLLVCARWTRCDRRSPHALAIVGPAV